MLRGLLLKNWCQKLICISMQTKIWSDETFVINRLAHHRIAVAPTIDFLYRFEDVLNLDYHTTGELTVPVYWAICKYYQHCECASIVDLWKSTHGMTTGNEAFVGDLTDLITASSLFGNCKLVRWGIIDPSLWVLFQIFMPMLNQFHLIINSISENRFTQSDFANGYICLYTIS